MSPSLDLRLFGTFLTNIAYFDISTSVSVSSYVK